VNRVDLRLYGILDPQRTGGRDPVDLVRRAVAGGCTLIQYRDKGADARRQVEQARVLKEALAGTGVPLIVNDRVDVALAAGADGVHLGQGDMHPNDARRLLGPEGIIGLTLATVEQADEMIRMRVNYGSIGGVFATAGQPDAPQPLGLEGLARIAFRARLSSGVPVGAAAGLDETNAASAIAAGADGVASISALFLADDPEAAARRLRSLVDEALAARGTMSSFGIAPAIP
jgi:thiamine-phosphate pyrophosphorylase